MIDIISKSRDWEIVFSENRRFIERLQVAIF